MPKENNIVVEVESWNPGVTTYSFFAPPDALLSLASKLERLAHAPLGARIDERVSARGNPNAAEVFVAFAQCTAEHVPQLRAASAHRRSQRVVGAIFFLVVATLSVIGFGSVVRYLGTLLH